MRRRRSLSSPARAVLTALLESPEGAHGYDLSQRAGVKSGTLYPLLIRLEGEGWLQAEWRPAPEPGRPPRHVYRLTAEGRRQATEAATIQQAASSRLAPGGAA